MRVRACPMSSARSVSPPSVGAASPSCNRTVGGDSGKGGYSGRALARRRMAWLESCSPARCQLLLGIGRRLEVGSVNVNRPPNYRLDHLPYGASTPAV